MDRRAELERVQGMMIFLASAAHGLENLLGRGATSTTFRAGRTAGLKAVAAGTPETDLDKALARTWDEMVKLGIKWAFEPYKKQAEPGLVTEKDGRLEMKLVFRHCMVRSALFRYGHPQKLSLCYMNHGLFCGLLEKICGRRCNLDIIHAGENACIKLLTIEPPKGS